MKLTQKRYQALAPFALAFTILITFWSVRDFDFINFDDPEYVTENPFVTNGLTGSGLSWAFTNTLTGHWHPFTWVSHMTDCQLFGVNAGAHHVVNLAFHIANALLLYCFLLKTTGVWGAALVAALVFGVHPLRIESVVWISERKDVLSVFFGLIALNVYVAFSRTRSLGAYALMCAMFIMSLLSKPTLVTLPALLLLIDIFPLKRYSRFTLSTMWPLIREKLPLFLVSGVFCGIAVVGQFLGGGLQSSTAYPVGDRIGSAMVGYVTYLHKLFAPVGLGIFYPFQSYAIGTTLGASLFLVALTILALFQLRTRPYISVGWAWFIVTLLPVAGFIQIGGQSVADRWTYLPHIGLIIGIVWGLRELLASSPRTQRYLATACIVALVAITESNLPHWRASIPLFLHTLEVSPNNFMAHTNLGDAYLKGGQKDEAVMHLEAAVRLAPTYPEALNNLGVLRAQTGEYAEAARLFSRALAQRPSFTTARYNLGLTQSHLGRNISALSEWVTVMRDHPADNRARESAASLQAFAADAPCATILRAEGAYAKTAIERLVAETSSWNPAPDDIPLQTALATLSRCL